MADFDNRIDELEDQTFREASDKQLQAIVAMMRLLVGMSKAVSRNATPSRPDGRSSRAARPGSASAPSSWRSRSCSPWLRRRGWF
jgi:hypothetical protein